MYLYLVAPFLKSRQHAADLARIESRIVEYGLAGKIVQLSQFLKFPSAVREFGTKRLSTLVLVGDDALLEEAVDTFASSAVVLGFIPLAESRIAQALGIPQGEAACDTIAARRITKLDLGKVENHHFLSSLHLQGEGLELHCPTFSIFPKGQAIIEVVNVGAGADPEDGKLTVRITPLAGRIRRKPLDQPTLLTAESCRLKAKTAYPVTLPRQYTLKLPLQIDIFPQAIKMIVGRRVGKEKTTK